MTDVPFTPLGEIEKAVARTINAVDLAQLIQNFFDTKRGRI